MVRPLNIVQPDHGPIAPPTEWQSTTPVTLLRNVLRLTAPNPGVMTGPGTNSYLVGQADTGFIVIDPGPNDAQHLQRLWAAAVHPDGSGGNIRAIVCTHSHPDHSPGAAPLQALCASSTNPRPPILGLASASTARAHSDFVPDQEVADDALLTLPWPDANSPAHNPQHTLKIIHTPGHAANHVCLLLQEDGLLFSGDHILNGSTTVIDPPDGNMHTYLQSLDKLSIACSAHQVHYILPAHGHVLDNALGAIAHLKAHRLKREAKIAAVMQQHPDGDLDAWLPRAYDDVPAALWPVARRSLLAHVERIQTLQAHTPRADTP
jgi:glyoxylase-like metal-dependent hydrolase (beta-lactamase superfamily II)